MKTLKTYLVILLAVLTSLSSCKRMEEPEEKEEVNVVKWKENGVWYHSEDNHWSYMPGGWGVGYKIYADSSIYFDGYDNPDYRRIKIRIQGDLLKKGVIHMDQGYYDFYRYSGSYAMYNRQEDYWWVDYYTRPGSGWVSIDWISEDKRKFKGRFEMTVYRDSDGSPLEITDGYFYIDMDKLDEEHSSGN